MGFAIGQIVQCVETWLPVPGFGFGDEVGPVAGCLYTIRGLEIHPSTGRPAVRVEEIVNAKRDYVGGVWEPSFGAFRFRPLDESRLTVFRQMLVTPPSQELVDEDLDARIADCERAVREALGF